LYETILATLLCVYFWIVFRKSRPDLPPSLAATRRKTSITQGMWNDTKIVASNKSFVFVTLCFMLNYSVFSSFGLVLSPLLSAYGYNPTQTALIPMGTVLFGTPAALLTGRYLDKTNKYHFSLKVESIGVAIAFAASIYFFTTSTDWGGACFSLLSGISLTPSIPICF
jgi:Na+/melibiose symporter-like transporter